MDTIGKVLSTVMMISAVSMVLLMLIGIAFFRDSFVLPTVALCCGGVYLLCALTGGLKMIWGK